MKGENEEEKEDGGRKSKSEWRVKQCEAGWEKLEPGQRDRKNREIREGKIGS